MTAGWSRWTGGSEKPRGAGRDRHVGRRYVWLIEEDFSGCLAAWSIYLEPLGEGQAKCDPCFGNRGSSAEGF